jgi:probable rRNA maturation factor
LRRSLKRMVKTLAPDDEVELSVALVGDGEICRLNREYRHVDDATDVLSFPQDAFGREEPGPLMLGDIVISVDTAAEQAGERGHSTCDEIELLAAHGLLHLLGYSHDDPQGAAKMAGAERMLLGGSIIGDDSGEV